MPQGKVSTSTLTTIPEVSLLEGPRGGPKELSMIQQPPQTYKQDTSRGTHMKWVLDTGAEHTVAPRGAAPPVSYTHLTLPTIYSV